MKRALLGVAACLLVLPNLVAAKDRTFSGEIMDSQCAAMGSHAAMMAKEGMAGKENDAMAKAMCAKNCVKMGGKYVLYDATTKTVYQLDDQSKPEQFAGQNVKITGTLDKATKTIHVTNIEPGS
jgi:hypothetical protein